MARPTRPSDRVREPVLLARTDDLPGVAGSRHPAPQYAAGGAADPCGAHRRVRHPVAVTQRRSPREAAQQVVPEGADGQGHVHPGGVHEAQGRGVGPVVGQHGDQVPGGDGGADQAGEQAAATAGPGAHLPAPYAVPQNLLGADRPRTTPSSRSPGTPPGPWTTSSPSTSTGSPAPPGPGGGGHPTVTGPGPG